MLYPLPARALVGFAALAALNVAAQSAGMPLAPARYQSAFEGYQAYSDDKLLPWKEANDAVGKIGGWRAYAKEAQAAQPDGAKEPARAGAAVGAAPAGPAAGGKR